MSTINNKAYLHHSYSRRWPNADGCDHSRYHRRAVRGGAHRGHCHLHQVSHLVLRSVAIDIVTKPLDWTLKKTIDKRVKVPYFFLLLLNIE